MDLMQGSVKLLDFSKIKLFTHWWSFKYEPWKERKDERKEVKAQRKEVMMDRRTWPFDQNWGFLNFAWNHFSFQNFLN